MSTLSEQPRPSRPELPTARGRRTQAAIDAAARAVVARNGILATTVADIAAEAGRSTASFYNYYDSKEAMVREWAMRFQDEANERARTVTEHGLTDQERVYALAAAHWNTYRHRLAEMISVTQLAMVNSDFAEYWAELCAAPIAFINETVIRAQARGFCNGDNPKLIAEAIVSMFNQFCYIQLSGGKADNDAAACDDPAACNDKACIDTLANIAYRAIYGRNA